MGMRNHCLEAPVTRVPYANPVSQWDRHHAPDRRERERPTRPRSRWIPTLPHAPELRRDLQGSRAPGTASIVLAPGPAKCRLHRHDAARGLLRGITVGAAGGFLYG